MQRDLAHLVDIHQAARLAMSYVQGMTKEAFLGDVQCQDSVVRRIEIIGEAARRVSPEGKAAWPGLPWNDMVRMRNRVIHEYDDVDYEIVWHTVQKDLPRLALQIEPLLPPER